MDDLLLFKNKVKEPIEEALKTARAMLEGTPPKVTDIAARRTMAKELLDIVERMRKFAQTIKPA